MGLPKLNFFKANKEIIYVATFLSCFVLSFVVGSLLSEESIALTNETGVPVAPSPG